MIQFTENSDANLFSFANSRHIRFYMLNCLFWFSVEKSVRTTKNGSRACYGSGNIAVFELKLI